MTIQFKCPDCDTLMGINEDTEMHECPNCETVITMDEADELFDQGELVGVLDEGEFPFQKGKKKDKNKDKDSDDDNDSDDKDSDDDNNNDNDSDDKDDKDMKKESYNGWQNQDTWATNLTLENEYKLYKAVIALGKDENLTEESIQEFVETANKKGDQFNDIDLDYVAWNEIVESFEDHVNEAKEISEDLVKALTDTNELSGDVIKQITTIFESVVAVKTNNKAMSLVEEYNNEIDLAKTEIQEEVEAEVDGYLDSVVKTWMNENELAIEHGIRTEITDSFLDGLQTLMKEHSIDVPEERFDIVDDLATKVEDLQEQLSNAETDNNILKEEILDGEKTVILNEVSADLADTEKERLKELAETLDYESDDKYKSDIQTLMESFIVPKRTSNKKLNEEQVIETGLITDEDDENTTPNEDTMIADAIRMLGKKD